MSVADLCIVGGGIVGLATARHLIRHFDVRVVVLEAEKQVASHQTGHNSGVIHSGLYYKPGSAKALNCRRGLEAMIDFCLEHDIPHRQCGKIVVALDPKEIRALDALYLRGQANGLKGLRRLNPTEIHEFEPLVRGVAGLHVPETGIVDYAMVARKYAELFESAGGKVVVQGQVTKVERRPGELILETPQGMFQCRYLINCGGLQCDRVARLCGLDPGLMVVPFRGEYYALKPHARSLVKGLIYPVPDPRFPFLGVHFTHTVHGAVEAGPNAVLAFAREGYTRWTVSFRDMKELLAYPGFWKLAGKFWRTGLGEMHRSFSRRAFYKALHRMLPALRMSDLEPFGAGVRAQVVEADGTLVDDFRFVQAENQIHVLNAPSPAATASLSIGQTIAEMAERQFELRTKKPRS